jgi:hypothetical protein
MDVLAAASSVYVAVVGLPPPATRTRTRRLSIDWLLSGADAYREGPRAHCLRADSILLFARWGSSVPYHPPPPPSQECAALRK